MLTVLEIVQDYEIEILLAKETFDPNISPVRAWATQVELDGIKESMAMGVEFMSEADGSATGPASFMVMDPDRNPILVDRRV